MLLQGLSCILNPVMTLETAFKRFSLFSHLIQMGNDEPPPSGMKRKTHWVGQKEAVEQKRESGEKKGGEPPKKKDSRGYREISSITLGEVDAAYKFYAGQLVFSPSPAWIAPNYFCMIHLAPKREPRPPALFGRIKTCYPSDGYLQNVQELELLLPSKDHAPDVVHLHANDILNTPERPLQSYCVRAKFLVLEEDIADFAGRETLFLQQGFAPEFSSAYIDLLDVNEHTHQSLPWMYVISSRWFASIPVSMQPEIREKLTKLIHWNKLIFNYHPEHLPREIRTLNRELGFKPGYTEIFLIEPENSEQTIQIVSKTFDKIFTVPIKQS